MRGQDIITDAEALKTIAAEQLGISLYAFRDVVDAFVSRLDPADLSVTHPVERGV